MKYSFKYIDNCPFCGSAEFRILGKRLNKSQGKFPRRNIGITTTVVKCRCCGLIFPNPLPVPDNIQDHYGVPPEDYWKPEYFNISDDYNANLFNWMNSIQKLEADAKILDIGAGIGKSMIALKRLGYDAYGIEPSSPFYKRAIDKMGVESEKLVCGSVENCEFEENTFDVILLTAVLEHLYDPSEVIKKILHWVKPNGLVFVQVPSADWLINKMANFYYKLIGTDYVANLSPMHNPYHTFEFTKKTFEIHARLNNYQIADCRYFLCDTFFPKMFDPLLIKYMKYTNSGMELAIWLRKNK